MNGFLGASGCDIVSSLREWVPLLLSLTASQSAKPSLSTYFFTRHPLLSVALFPGAKRLQCFSGEVSMDLRAN